MDNACLCFHEMKALCILNVVWIVKLVQGFRFHLECLLFVELFLCCFHVNVQM